MEHLFCNMISITCWLLLFLIGILAVALLIMFQSLESCHFFLLLWKSCRERDSSQENISAQLVKRWENSRHKKGKINCCLKSQAQLPWCRQALKMKVACKGNDLESFLIWALGKKWLASSCTQSFPLFYSSISYPACIFTAFYFSVLLHECVPLLPCFVHLSADSHSCCGGSQCQRELKKIRICSPHWWEETDGLSSGHAEGRQANASTKQDCLQLIIIIAGMPFYQFVHKVVS